MIVLILLSRFAKITTLSTTASSNIQRRQYIQRRHHGKKVGERF